MDILDSTLLLTDNVVISNVHDDHGSLEFRFSEKYTLD